MFHELLPFGFTDVLELHGSDPRSSPSIGRAPRERLRRDLVVQVDVEDVIMQRLTGDRFGQLNIDSSRIDPALVSKFPDAVAHATDPCDVELASACRIFVARANRASKLSPLVPWSRENCRKALS